MQNSTILKNELIFEYAAGTTSLSKSLMASTYLFLNSRETSLYHQFENYCGSQFENTKQLHPKNLTAEDCIKEKNINYKKQTQKNTNPINKFIKSYSDIVWKSIFKGFYEYTFLLPTNEKAKLIKMDPGTSVPLHSHSGKEYILVLEGSFSDEYGNYSKGDLQINDSQIKHMPITSDKEGCICLTITEKDISFYGPFAPILNLVTVIKSFFIK
ncbi:cupin domain-containing protein [Alphaproteobacteria bacterium]|nr:cupin domain-containing protein [Alphaproteobacteria bacterium]